VSTGVGRQHDAGIVEEDMERAKGPLRRRNHLGAILAAGDVGLQRDGRAARARDRLCCGHRRCAVEIDDGDPGAFGREAQRRLAAEPAASTGDEGNLSGQSHQAPPLSSLPR
jgi:hypothetical protein